MRNQILISFLSLTLTYCYGQTIENKILSFNGWTAKINKGVTDTTRINMWFPDAEISVILTNNKDSDCLNPKLDFYPIALEQYIKSKLSSHLMLRANLFPPSPTIYRSNEHIILGWNLVDYDKNICCNCIELESELIQKLELKTEFKFIGE